MKDCVFLLADTNMQEAFRGFLTREDFHLKLQIRPLLFDPLQDMIVDRGGNDPGVYNRAHEILRSYQTKYRYAVIVLDNKWDGSPGVTRIRQHIGDNMCRNGWSAERFSVIVIDPELEIWIWQNSPHIAPACGFTEFAQLQGWLHERGMWPIGAQKPVQPKKAIEDALRRMRQPRSSAIYRRITSQVSVRRCTDPAFDELRKTLQKWFSNENARGSL